MYNWTMLLAWFFPQTGYKKTITDYTSIVNIPPSLKNANILWGHTCTPTDLISSSPALFFL